MESKTVLNPIEIMQKLFNKDYENKVCVECKAPMPSYVSINNAIIICKNCADKHKKLGYNISYIREITSDWDPYLLSFLERGGNSRFIRLSKKYDLDFVPIEEKFKTKILEYYRLLIKSEVLADEPPFEIPLEEAKKQIEEEKIYFPEFENYELFKGKEVVEKQPSSLVSAFRFVGNGLGSLANYLGEKYHEYNVGGKLYNGGASVYNGIKSAGQYIYSSSKPVVKYASIKAVQGVGYLCKQAEYHLSDEEDNKDEENKNDNNININKKDEKKKLLKSCNSNYGSIILEENGKEFNNCIFMPTADFPEYEEINKSKLKDSINNSIESPIIKKEYSEDKEAPKPIVLTLNEDEK